MSRRAWTEAQIAILRQNPTLPSSALTALVSNLGPPRTSGAIDEKRRSISIPVPPPERIVCLEPWPRVPSREKADGIFVRALITAMRAEGLLIVRAA